MRSGAALLLLLSAGCAGGRSHVVLVTMDGTRWQEIFRGADPEILGDGKESAGARAAYWRESVDDRRRALAPFLWGTVRREGQLLGNLDAGNEIQVLNRFRFSYPGYHELLCGFASKTIDSNAKVPNPDLTVLEWLHRRPGFEGSVAAFCSWDVFPSILNRERCGFPIDIGEPTPEMSILRRLTVEVGSPWQGSIYDAFVYHAAMDYVREKRPRVLYLAFGDTDEWAHAGSYDRYLESIHREDGWLAELWRTLQAMPEYAGCTTLLVTCDHGRGDNPDEWRRHNDQVSGAGYVWLAALGPRIASRGEGSKQEVLTQGQIAATVSAAVGEDFSGANPQAAPPLSLFTAGSR